jgi:hypothetical protein
MTWIASKITIQGIKGVLDRSGEFELSKKNKPKSIAVFGRNAHGKSGYADAIEYLFSVDGEVEHLGKGSADSEQGGKHALPHVLAAEKGIVPQITANFINDTTGEVISVTRLVITGRNDVRPPELTTLLEKAPAYRVLRQHDLRRFVVDMTPGQKFEEFARWIGLKSATIVLKHLTTVEGTLRETSVDREINERLRSIRDHTQGAVNVFDIHLILNWCSTEIGKQLGQVFTIARIQEIENGIAALKAKRETIISQAQAATTNLKNVSSEFLGHDGYLKRLMDEYKNAIKVEARRDEIKAKAKESVFQEVWDISKTFLESHVVENCPICQTPWDATITGSQETTVISLDKSLMALSDLKVQDAELQQHIHSVKVCLQQIETRLTEISSFAKTIALDEITTKSDELHARAAYYQQTLDSAIKSKESVVNLLNDCQELTEKHIPIVIEAVKVDTTLNPTDEIDILISHLQGLNEALLRLETLTKQQDSIRNIEIAFGKIADTIRSETKKVADNAVAALKDDVQKIYKKIHPGEAVPNVFIKLNTEEKTLAIRVNFHSNERVVPPGGYLSEAQINTLGLALFLSSVRLFNKEFPFIFLDDIVSSYDADSRARIVDVLAEDMSDFQIFLTTHDERFYTHLRGRLEGENWIFERITSYNFENGPRRESDNLRPEQINELILQGDEKIAGNAVRQYMEDWFDTTCEKYWVYTPHKKGIREFKRTLFDYWEPFVNRITSAKAEFGKYILVSDSYKRFSGGLMPIINYYSHNQTNPYEWAAMGDVQYIWDEFQKFMDLFRCASCKKSLQYDFNDKKFYCTCGGAIMLTAPSKTAEAKPK